MAEFIEYIRQLHYKLRGSAPKKVTRNSLPNDSIDEITDLSQDGILTSSSHLLTQADRQSLKRYVYEMRHIQRLNPKKHDCGYGSNDKSNGKSDTRTMVEMELKTVTANNGTRNFEVDAH